MSEQLTGDELLGALKGMKGMSIEEQCHACGYFSTPKGKVRLNRQAFYKACAIANGVELGVEAGESGQGRKLSFKATTNSVGQGIIGAAYMKMVGLETGDRFQIKVGRKNITISGAPLEDEDEKETTEDVVQAPAGFGMTADTRELVAA
jgi:hypothetical protein